MLEKMVSYEVNHRIIPLIDENESMKIQWEIKVFLIDYFQLKLLLEMINSFVIVPLLVVSNVFLDNKDIEEVELVLMYFHEMMIMKRFVHKLDNMDMLMLTYPLTKIVFHLVHYLFYSIVNFLELKIFVIYNKYKYPMLIMQ